LCECERGKREASRWYSDSFRKESAVIITNHPIGCTVAALKDILFGMDFHVAPESIMMKTLADGIITQVRIEDPQFAKLRIEVKPNSRKAWSRKAQYSPNPSQIQPRNYSNKSIANANCHLLMEQRFMVRSVAQFK
jgi:hypothetical protein